MNKKKIFLIIAFSLALLVVYVFIYEPKYSGDLSFDFTTKPEIFVHRGGGYFAPDNSLKSALKSINEGFPGVDIDVQMTKDGELVVFHDLSVDRLTDSTGKVKELNLSDLTKLDLGKKFSTTTNDYFVSSFDTFVAKVVGNGGKISAELKVTGIGDTGMEQKAIDIVQKYNAYDKVIFSSFNPLVLYRLKHIDPNIKTMYIFMDTNWNEDLLKEIKKEDYVSLPWILRQEWIRVGIRKIIKPDYLSVNYKVDSQTIKKLLNLGYPIFIWTPESKEDLQNVIDLKPFGIYTDNQYIAEDLLK